MILVISLDSATLKIHPRLVTWKLAMNLVISYTQDTIKTCDVETGYVQTLQ